jgi:uncharacterized protein
MSLEQHAASADVPVEPVRWGMGDAVAGNVVILVAGIVAFSVAFDLFGWEPGGERALWQVALLQVPVWLGLAGAPLWATHRKGRSSLRADFGLTMRWTDVPLGFAVGILGQFVLGLTITVLYEVLGIDVDRVGRSAEALTGAAEDLVGVALLVLVVVIAAPVLEELFYRGLWLRAAERRVGRVWAVVGTSVLFGLVHGEPYDLPALIGIGLILAVLTVRTGRLGPAIWAHLAFNSTTVASLLLLS